MPRYYFNIRHRFAEMDSEGAELANLQAARLAAVRLSGEMIRDLGQSLWDTPVWRLEVTDARQIVLFTLTFLGKDHAPGPPA